MVTYLLVIMVVIFTIFIVLYKKLNDRYRNLKNENNILKQYKKATEERAILYQYLI